MAEVKEPDLALAGLALLVIFGLLIWYDHPVESARPFGPYIQHQDLQTTGYIYESCCGRTLLSLIPSVGNRNLTKKKNSKLNAAIS